MHSVFPHGVFIYLFIQRWFQFISALGISVANHLVQTKVINLKRLLNEIHRIVVICFDGIHKSRKKTNSLLLQNRWIWPQNHRKQISTGEKSRVVRVNNNRIYENGYLSDGLWIMWKWVFFTSNNILSEHWNSVYLFFAHYHFHCCCCSFAMFTCILHVYVSWVCHNLSPCEIEMRKAQARRPNVSAINFKAWGKPQQKNHFY